MKRAFLALLLGACLIGGNALAKVNVNEASLEELDTLPGIGEARAQAIIDYRRRNGPFKSLRDLKKVPELSDSVVDGMKGKVAYTGPTRIDGADEKAADKTVPTSAERSAVKRAARAEERDAATPQCHAAPSRPVLAAPAPSPVGATPARPAMPGSASLGKPATPATPATPAGPARPATLGVQGDTAAPAASPAAPARPAMPGKPAAPAIADKPSNTSAPARPAAPASPMAKPAAPAMPGKASGEAHPAAPASPVAKPVPAAPAKPAAPAMPARPAMPAQPAGQ